MITIEENAPLYSLNTFRIAVTARYKAEVRSTGELQQLLGDDQYQHLPILVLGGGSNVLFTRDFAGLVIQISIPGIELVREDERHYYVRAGAGVNWHELVMYCVTHNYAGMENLSLIPGTVGAAPMQNIGAYGVEVEQLFESLRAVHRQTGAVRSFTHADCQFGYRESVFKRALKDQYIITDVTFRLDKQPIFHTTYGAIRETLDAMAIDPDELTIQAISQAVIAIRRSKLPDPAEIGNAGSFFKNPEIPHEAYTQLKANYPTMPGYPVDSDMVKVPAGWLIEQAGWKGYRAGEAGVHVKQALVLVNYGGASGHDILDLAKQVQESIQATFGIALIPEVNIV